MSTIGNEQDYINDYLKELSTKSVRYGQDYLARTLPSSLRIKRQPIKKQTASISTPTDTTQSTTANTKETGDALELVIKTLKPASQFRITRLSLDDTVLNLKQRIYQQKTIPAKQQRLLLKGKVLNDDKTLRDYQLTKDATLHLMINKATSSTAPVTSAPSSSSQTTLSSQAQTTVKSEAFWKSLEQTLEGKLDAADAQLVLETWKKALSS
ncbi:ubiquitin-related domain-containing protein [Halteromyces radiatus]|uniref:ubiquitin-related domain-containing protein n=1 Tax=Halteromyces radiatus TaxID=101107 RepID=UPI00221E4D3D|nr:ubiquitin-related domain-containing protein [Halteromyces radiatus]KAI8089928.1 ubiquitin-related domain-containing protein [Halteromyces radiatus]